MSIVATMLWKCPAIIACLLFGLLEHASAGDVVKPQLKEAADGFPTGQGIPEGVACDLARAFINRDPALFSRICVKFDVHSKDGDAYAAFLKSAEESMRQEAAQKKPSPGGPKAIGKVFAARHLKMNGPASLGYAAFNFQDVMFVDVGVFLQNGERSLNRTLVIKNADGKWYVDPYPSAFPLLSEGLNEEAASQKDFLDVYDVEK
jgi:hypothetical protein